LLAVPESTADSSPKRT